MLIIPTLLSRGVDNIARSWKWLGSLDDPGLDVQIMRWWEGPTPALWTGRPTVSYWDWARTRVTPKMPHQKAQYPQPTGSAIWQMASLYTPQQFSGMLRPVT